ncbi:ECs_2282 family putative zinc-binding protein [Aeromonas hydrophila]|uniref:ECs_2282 family putative zinc-binding protein n=1 Tax=Aeromonas hydrophila TaxID=644 RepID=UPI0023610C34|nr:hypothetical protein [Aeromonas hydrophila]
MKSEYTINATMLCPICGNDQFEIVSEQLLICSDCKNSFDKESLIEQNSTSIDAMVEDLQKEFISDVKKDLKKMLKGFKR